MCANDCSFVILMYDVDAFQEGGGKKIVQKSKYTFMSDTKVQNRIKVQFRNILLSDFIHCLT